MRYRMLATYRGVPYEAGVGPTGSDVVLFAACPPPEELGFEPATGHWRKRVIRAEIDALWESRPVGTFRGELCLVLDDLGDRLHIAYLGPDTAAAGRLGYWQIDRGVFELLTPREDVTGLTEERLDKPLALAPPLSVAHHGTGYLGPGQPGQPGQPGPGLADPYGELPLPSEHVPGGIAYYEAEPGEPVYVPDEPGPPTYFQGEPGPPAYHQDEPGLPAYHQPGAAQAEYPEGRYAEAEPAQAGFAQEGYAEAGPARDPYQQGELNGAGPPALDGAGVLVAQDTAAGLPTPGAAGGSPAPARAGNAGRSASRQRVTVRDVFCELADLAAIPRTAYALGTEVEGVLCLLPTAAGFEVFIPTDGARHEVRSFADEEAAYFYLFGVLAAEAIQGGRLSPASLRSATP